MTSSRSAGGGVSSTCIASGVGCAVRRSPIVDMIDVTLSSRSGCSIAIVCTIIPPIDVPTMCADGDVEVVEQADRVGGHVGERVRHVGHVTAGQHRRHHRVGVDLDTVELGRQAAVAVVEPDRRAARDRASIWQKLVLQAIIWAVKPMTSSRAGSSGAEGVVFELDSGGKCRATMRRV